MKPQNLHSPASPDRVDPSAQPPASDPLVPPRPVNLSVSPWLLPPLAPPETLDCEATPGCLVPSALPWSVVTLAPRTCLGPWSHGSASDLGSSDSTLNVHLRDAAHASCASGVTRSHQLSIIALGSPEISSSSVFVGCPAEVYAYSLAPPFNDTAVGCRHPHALHLAAPPIYAPLDAPSVCPSLKSLPACLPTL